MPAALVISKQNYLLSNRQIEGANWSDLSTTRVGGQPDPQGGNAACQISEVAAVAQHTCYNSGSLIAARAPNTWVCASACFKAGTRNFGGFYLDIAALGQVYALWDLRTGVSSLLSLSGTGSSAVAQSADSMGNGWWRTSVRFYFAASSVFYVRLMISDVGNTNAGYLGDITKNIYAFAPGLAFANWPGDLTDTTASTFTAPSIRNLADNA